MLTRWL